MKQSEGNQNKLTDENHQTKVMRYGNHLNKFTETDHQKEERQYEENQRLREQEHQRRNKSDDWKYPKKTVGYLGRGKHLLDSSPPTLQDELLLPRLSSPAPHQHSAPVITTHIQPAPFSFPNKECLVISNHWLKSHLGHMQHLLLKHQDNHCLIKPQAVKDKQYLTSDCLLQTYILLWDQPPQYIDLLLIS